MAEHKQFELHINTIISIVVIALAALGYVTWYYYDLSEQQKSEISSLTEEVSTIKTSLAQASAQLTETSGQLADATNQKDSLTKEKETLANQKRTAEQTAQNAKADAQEAKNVADASTALALFMAQKAGELDTILLEYDRISTVAIEWFIANGYFDNPSDADYVYSSWTNQINQLSNRYQVILREIENLGEY